MATAVTEQGTPRGGTARKVVTIGGLLGVLTFWYGPGQPIQSAACMAAPAGTPIPTWLCRTEFRAIPEAEAAASIDQFLRYASGSAPGHAYEILSAEVQAEHESFEKTWAPILFADRVGPLEPVEDGFNEYTVTYVAYDGEGEDVGPLEGDVNAYAQQIGLLRVGNEVEITRYGPLDRVAVEGVDTGRLRYHREQPVAVTQTFDTPARDNIAAPSVQPTTWLSLLCQVRTNAGEWWSRTGWGWVAHADLQAGSGRRADVPLCGSQNIP